MDLLEYRAMKAQEEAQKNSSQGGEPSDVQTQSTAVASHEPLVQGTPSSEPVRPEQSNETTTPVEPSANTNPEPQFFEINGEKVSLEELQRGYMRQSDYTKKTQAVAQQARQAQEAMSLLEQLQQNPQVAQQLNINPTEIRLRQLESQNQDLLLQQEIDLLSTKYPDFEAMDVLQFAHQRQMDNLEDAYLLNKTYKANNAQYTQSAPVQPNNSQIDVEALKAQLRAELQAELNTSTLITNQVGSAPTAQHQVELRPDEIRVAKLMGMTPEEYAKWR
jgi:phage I-like protein